MLGELVLPAFAVWERSVHNSTKYKFNWRKALPPTDETWRYRVIFWAIWLPAMYYSLQSSELLGVANGLVAVAYFSWTQLSALRRNRIDFTGE